MKQVIASEISFRHDALVHRCGKQMAALEPDIIVPALAMTSKRSSIRAPSRCCPRDWSARGLAEPSAQDSWRSPSIWPSSTLTSTRGAASDAEYDRAHQAPDSS
jgi:hypothetical protein